MLLHEPLPSTCEPAGCDRPPIDGERWLTRWIALCAGLVFLALAWPALAGRMYVFDDLGAFHLPLRDFYSRCLAEGSSFDWLPQLYTGLYLTGEGQVGTYHPLHWLLYRLLPLERAFCCELLFSYLWMFAGTVGFLRRHLSWPAAVWGGLVFTFSGFNLLHLAHMNAIAIVAHLPWLLWAIDVVLRPTSRRAAAVATVGVALLTGSQLLLGYPQYVWFSLLAEAVYASWPWWRWRVGQASSLGVQAGRLHYARAGAWRLLLVAQVLGLMIGAVQLLPTAESLSTSVRQATDARFALSGSLAPANFVQLVAPYLLGTRVLGENTHELGIYCGAVPLLLVVWWLANWGRVQDKTGVARWSLALGAIALLLALGAFGPLYRVQLWLPVVSKFRMPCRYVVLFQFAIALLSACAFADLSRRNRTSSASPSRLWPVWTVAVISVFVAVAAAWWFDRQKLAGVSAIIAGPILITLAASVLTLAARNVRAALPVLAVLAAADLGVYGLSYSVYPHTERLEEFKISSALPANLGQDRVAFSLPSAQVRSVSVGNAMLLAGASRLDGYLGLPPAKALDYRQPSALRVASVRWVRRNDQTARIPGIIPRGCGWLEVPDPLPPFRLVTQTVVSRDSAKDLPFITIGSTALVEDPLDISAGPPGTVQIVSHRPGQIRLLVNAPTRQLLSVAESYHSGWQAKVDGRQTPVLRVNGDFFGCAVPAGSHDVRLAFRPASLRYGMSISILGLGLTAVLFLTRTLSHSRSR